MNVTTTIGGGTSVFYIAPRPHTGASLFAAGQMFERGGSIARDTRRSPAWRERAVLREGMALLDSRHGGAAAAAALLAGYVAEVGA